MNTSVFERNHIKIGVELSKFMESSFPVDVKECYGKWKYIENNEYAASVSGLDPSERVGMNIYDIGMINHIPTKAIEKVVHADRNVELGKAPVTLMHAFLSKPEGSMVVDQVVKQAVVDQKDKMVAILSYARNIVPYIDRIDLYSLYKNYYPVEEAIQRFLTHMNVNTFFAKMPTDLELSLILYDKHQADQLSQILKLPLNDIHFYQDCIRDKLIMIDYVELVQKLQIPETMSFD